MPRAPRTEGESRIVLYGVSWQEYGRLLEAFGTRRIRLTYDQGTLEIMTISGLHEWWKRRFGLILPLLGYLLGVGVQGYGSTTLRREDAARGLEPDEGFYIGTASGLRGPRDIHLPRDPAPDLAIEIDMSPSALNRLALYAALQISEVWRWDGRVLQVYSLRPDGTYEVRDQSRHFPSLPLAGLAAFLEQTADLGEDALIGPFLEWARTHVLPHWPSNPSNA
jgi:Uma2 family endonuclease